MTRSLGDKIGPRSCVAFPEIGAVTVPAGRHARFVLASDGFWDVVSIDTVRLLALCKKFKSNKALASALALKAVRRRERAGIRQDDITVMVVDVNIGAYRIALLCYALLCSALLRLVFAAAFLRPLSVRLTWF